MGSPPMYKCDCWPRQWSVQSLVVMALIAGGKGIWTLTSLQSILRVPRFE